MSYAEKSGDKFYEMNPKDAREGDEHLSASNEWVMLSLNDAKLCHLEPLCETRRLIAPGEGWRILSLDELMPAEFQDTKDGVIWTPHVSHSLFRKLPISNYVRQSNYEVLAIRQRIPVEAGKDTINSNANRDLQINIALDECEHIARRLRWLKEQPADPRIQSVIDAAREYVDKANSDYGRDCALDEYSTLESALTALGEDVCASCGHTKLDHQYITCPQFKPKEPEKDDEWPRYWLWRNTNLHRQNANGSSDSWLPSANWKRSVHMNFDFSAPSYKRLTPAEAQARMEGDEWYLAWVRDNGGEELSDQQRKVIQHYIKWHAAKTKGDGE